MSAQASDNRLFVDDVVTALTGPVDGSAHGASALRNQMRRAADDFDLRTAEAFARALLESLCRDQLDLRRLEALLILGLAHPTILEKHRISLQTEGRRLAMMLEHEGQVERARCLLETLETRVGEDGTVIEDGSTKSEKPKVDTQQHIELCLRRADECASRGKTTEAIRWLQEVVLVDRNRRDVARMIRDLRWQEKERKLRLARRSKLAALLLVVGVALAGLVWRESHIDEQYRAIPAAAGDLASLRERQESLETLIASHRVWFGMTPVLREQTRLFRDISRLEEAQSIAAHQQAAASARKLETAEDARSRGMLLAQQGKFEEALSDLRMALELTDKSWEPRARVQADVDAIEAWMKKSR